MRARSRSVRINPDTHLDYNVSFSLGIKIPTGEDDATDYFYRPGRRRPVLRPVDLAIQPGDGIASIADFQINVTYSHVF